MKFNIDSKKNEVVNKYESKLAELKETETVLIRIIRCLL